MLLSVNEVFAHAMREKETEIDYDEAAMLRPGGGQPFGAPVEIHLIAAREEGGEEGTELPQGYRYEASFVAKRIKELEDENRQLNLQITALRKELARVKGSSRK